MKTAFLFSGQGAQYIGMGKELYTQYACAREVFDQVELDFDVKDVCFHGPSDRLHDTQYAQACIFVVSMACARVLQEYGITPNVCAGLSLGEYSALCYGGAFDVKTGARIVRERGMLMANALPKGTSAMAAVLMLDKVYIQKACQEVAHVGVCEIANYNCPGQIVITGEKKAVEEASKRCLEKGARRVLPLEVSGAFHSSLLKDAGMKLYDVLTSYTMQPSSIPVYNNITGCVEQGAIADILSKQLSSSVYFEQTIHNMIQDGVTHFIEVGPGKVVSGFVKKCTKSLDVTIAHVEDPISLQATRSAFNKA